MRVATRHRFAAERLTPCPSDFMPEQGRSNLKTYAEVLQSCGERVAEVVKMEILHLGPFTETAKVDGQGLWSPSAKDLIVKTWHRFFQRVQCDPVLGESPACSSSSVATRSRLATSGNWTRFKRFLSSLSKSTARFRPVGSEGGALDDSPRMERLHADPGRPSMIFLA